MFIFVVGLFKKINLAHDIVQDGMPAFKATSPDTALERLDAYRDREALLPASLL